MTAMIFARLVLALPFLAVPPQGAQEPPKPLAITQEADKLLRGGDLNAAIARFRTAVKADPKLFEARLGLGRALDLAGEYRAAREQLEQAIQLASDDARNTALTAMGISYAFEAKADEAARYYQRVFDRQMQANDRSSAAETANALGRIYLESGNLTKAEQWYQTGYQTSKQISEQPADRLALWDMRWQNALGRIAARRGDRRAAMRHAVETKALLDKGGNEQQRPFYPYLMGYIAFYMRDYRMAIEQLLKGDQTDAFVLGLIGQSHEKLRQPAKAREYYEKVLASPAHSINAAFARPHAQAFLKRQRSLPLRRRR
jgi:tetratricopeptide (TPR) repeat protein